MLEAKHILKLVETHIQNAGFPDEPKGLYDPAKYILSAGGKRIRPCLTLMSANLFTDHIEPQIPVALAMEVFHNFTLVHDDIMDNAPVRRGLQTVHEKWNIHTGILSGDAMLIQAYKLICQSPSPVLPKLLEMFNNTALLVCEGQQSDMDFEHQNEVTLDAYIQMISNKTSVLLGCCMYCGAIAAGANEADALHLYKTGLELGISFQIQDDVLDAYGDEATFGKKPGGDIVQNKKTFLVLKALSIANADDNNLLAKLYTDKSIDTDKKIEAVLTIFNQYEIRKLAEDTMEQYYQSAITAFEAVNVPGERKVALAGLIESVFKRTH